MQPMLRLSTSLSLRSHKYIILITASVDSHILLIALTVSLFEYDRLGFGGRASRASLLILEPLLRSLSSLSDSESDEELEPESELEELELELLLELEPVSSPSSASLFASPDISSLSLLLSIHIFRLGLNSDMLECCVVGRKGRCEKESYGLLPWFLC